MTRNISGIPASAASTEHVINYVAYTPDDGETRGVATVTSTLDSEGRTVVPFAQLAVIPGFVEGDVIDHAEGERRPLLLGPGTDAPGHVAWCHTHDDAMGDGTSVCLGEVFEVDGDGDDDEDTGAGSLRAGLATSVSEGTRVFIDRYGENSVSLSAAREFALLLLSLVDQAEAGNEVSR